MALSKLPFLPEKATYAYQNRNEVISVELDGGFSRSRRDIVGATSIVNCTWVLDRNQYQYFRAFYSFETKRGANQFLIDLILEQPYQEEHTAKFVPDSLQTSDPFGLSFAVRAQLEVQPIIDDDFNEVVLLLYDEKDENETIASLFEQLVNVDLEV